MTLFYLGLAWLAGIKAGQLAHQSAPAWLLFAALAAALLLALRTRDPHLRLPLACVTFFALGGARYQAGLPRYTPQFVSTYNCEPETQPSTCSGSVIIEGVVVGEPDVRDTYANLRVRADLLLLPDATQAIPVTGLVLARVARFPEYQYGDRLRVSGSLETPPVFETFSYADYLARSGVYSLLRFADATLIAHGQANRVRLWIYEFKAQSLKVLERIFPQPSAALLQGILLGVDSRIPKELTDAFSATGTSHIIAISGFNISIIAGIFSALSTRLLGPRRGVWVAIGGIAFYTFLVGANASVVRAAIMGGLALLSRRAGRPTDGLSALLLAAFLMTLINPLTLWDVGFQLSFFATLGLILYADPLTQAFIRVAKRFTTPERAERIAGPVGDAFLLTLAAQITTLPLIAYYFQRVSLVSFLANMLVLPAQPAVMVLSGIALIGGLIWLPLGQLLSWLAFPFVAFTINVVELLARVPGATLNLPRASWLLLTAAYVVLFGVTLLVARGGSMGEPKKRSSFLSWVSTGVLAVLAVVSILAWHTVLRMPDGKLRLTVLDVGKGDAVLIQTPGGRWVLVDGGSAASTLTSAIGERLPLFDRRLDWVVIAAPDEDHVAALADMLGQVQVGSVLAAGEAGTSAAYRALLGRLADAQIPVVTAVTGQTLNLGGGAKLEVVRAGVTGGVLRVSWEKASFLLPIGLDADTHNQLLARGGMSSSFGLLLPAGGADVALNSEEFIRAVNPGLAVISLEAGAPPESVVLKRLEGRTVLRTDLNGWIEWATDGQRAWVTTEK